MDEIVVEGSRSLFSNGVLGVVVAGLVYFVMMLRAELRDVRAAHRVELAAKDALILELQEKRIAAHIAGAELAKQMRETLSELLARSKG